MRYDRQRMRLGSGALVLIDLDTRSSGDPHHPLHRRIYEELRQQILDGRLRRGARLPSTRALAVDLRVSRSTGGPAFGQLRAEGYIDSVTRGSTRVSTHSCPIVWFAPTLPCPPSGHRLATPSRRAAAPRSTQRGRRA